MQSCLRCVPVLHTRFSCAGCARIITYQVYRVVRGIPLYDVRLIFDGRRALSIAVSGPRVRTRIWVHGVEMWWMRASVPSGVVLRWLLYEPCIPFHCWLSPSCSTPATWYVRTLSVGVGVIVVIHSVVAVYV